MSDKPPLMPFKIAISVLWSTFWRAYLMTLLAAAIVFGPLFLYVGTVGATPLAITLTTGIMERVWYGLFFTASLTSWIIAVRLALRRPHWGHVFMLVQKVDQHA